MPEIPNVTPSIINAPGASAKVSMESGRIASGIGAAIQMAAGSANLSTALSVNCTRVSICAVGCDIRYQVGVGAQVATLTTHFIGERDTRDFVVQPGSHIAVIRAGTVSGVLEVSELS